MTRDQANNLAAKNSIATGCVQHVNRLNLTNYAEHDAYEVSDWFDSDSTVATYYKGKE